MNSPNKPVTAMKRELALNELLNFVYGQYLKNQKSTTPIKKTEQTPTAEDL
ncbi:MAG: hypothetical protein ABIS59_02190 [Candidatus Saccharibacteria bacterium]